MDLSVDVPNILWFDIETSQMNRVTDNKENNLNFEEVQLSHVSTARVIYLYKVSTQ